MDSKLIYAFILTLLAGLSTSIGSAVVLFSKRFSSKFLAASLGFSAGVMIFISLVELFNDSRTRLGEIYGDRMGFLYALIAFFGGIAVIAIIDNMVPSYENPHEVGELSITDTNHDANNKQLMRVGVISSLVIAIHNFPEGIATFVSAMNDPGLGLSIAVAIGIHNIPEGIAVAIPIYYATKSKRKAFTNATLSGLAEPVGAVIGYFLLSFLFHDNFMGIIFAAVAGIMVYISLDELLPTAEKYLADIPVVADGAGELSAEIGAGRAGIVIKY